MATRVFLQGKDRSTPNNKLQWSSSNFWSIVLNYQFFFIRSFQDINQRLAGQLLDMQRQHGLGHGHGRGRGRGHGSFSVSTLLLIVANLLIPAAILIFATGFFPYKPFLPGLADYQSVVSGSPPKAPFDRVIFMVVDALRRYEAFVLKVMSSRRVAK